MLLNRNRIFLLNLFVFLAINSGLFAQAKPKKVIYSPEEFNKRLIYAINKLRAANGLDSFEVHDVLIRASSLSSAKMAKQQRADNASLAKTTPYNMKKAGGTSKAEELVFATVIGKGKNELSCDEMVATVMKKWGLGKKEKEIILRPSNVYIGLTSQPDEQDKKAYISAVFGNYQSFNEGAKLKKQLKVPYNTKSKSLKDPDPRKCKNCEKFKDHDVIHSGLYVENGKVYLKYNDLRKLKRLIKKSTDGFAVDIIQKDQYTIADPNIMDNNLRNKGVMLKPVYKDKIFAKNLIKPDPKKKKKQRINSLLLEMGKFPKDIKGPYELNLLVIQDGYVCKTVMRAYKTEGDGESNTPLEMLPVPESITARLPPFEPRSETAVLTFVVPFEKNKSEFKPEDIKPFIDALQEPDFFIEGLYIYAYSSIEGDSVANAKLQRKRAESVVHVLQGMQADKKISPTIMTTDSWALFQLTMEDGKYDFLTKMSKKEAIKKINTTRGLSEELEPFLAKQRFAQIVMDVTYDISGKKEEKFAVAQFNKNLKTGNYKQAYKIMDYIAKKVRDGGYSEEAWDAIVIPDDPKYVNFKMNKIYYDYVANGKVVTDEHWDGLKALQKVDPANNYLSFNNIFCKIRIDSTIGDKTAQAETQAKIDGFYKTDIPKKYVDGLNIEWQFKIIESLDTVDGAEAQVDACIAKIKSFYNFNESSWQNSLKLAFIFARAKDYRFAVKLLDPHLRKVQAEDKFFDAYISLSSHVPEKFFSQNFVYALKKLQELDPVRFCHLFSAPYMSFQTLDNPAVKKLYRQSKCQIE